MLGPTVTPPPGSRLMMDALIGSEWTMFFEPAPTPLLGTALTKVLGVTTASPLGPGLMQTFGLPKSPWLGWESMWWSGRTILPIPGFEIVPTLDRTMLGFVCTVPPGLTMVTGPSCDLTWSSVCTILGVAGLEITAPPGLTMTPFPECELTGASWCRP